MKCSKKKYIEQLELRTKNASPEQEKNKKAVADAPDSLFAYIYTWIEVDENGDGVKPHRAKMRPGEAWEPTKMRINEYPIAADIIDYLCNNPSIRYKTNESIKSSVGGVLPKLVKTGRIMRIGNSYYPTTVEYKRKLVAPDLANFATLEENCFFSVSKNTFIIYFNATDLSKEKEFIKNYLGKDCFEVFSYEGRLFVLLKGNNERCARVGVQLRKMVRDAYMIQQSGQEAIRKKLRQI